MWESFIYGCTCFPPASTSFKLWGPTPLWGQLFQGQGLFYGWDVGLVQVINYSPDYAVQMRSNRMEGNEKVLYLDGNVCMCMHLCVCVPLKKVVILGDGMTQSCTSRLQRTILSVGLIFY